MFSNSWTMSNSTYWFSVSKIAANLIRIRIELDGSRYSDEDQRRCSEYMEYMVTVYRENKGQNLLSSPFPDLMHRLSVCIEDAFKVAKVTFVTGSLIMIVQCPTLESLECLWNGYCSGYLNDIIESFLVTDELKRKLGMDNVSLKTTIAEENYSICKKALMETSGKMGSLSRAFVGNWSFACIH